MSFEDLKKLARFDRVGFAGVGGCGVSDLVRLMRTVEPDKFPGLRLAAMDANRRALEVALDPSSHPLIKAWWDSGRLYWHVLGYELFRGDGAGADPSVGRDAVRCKESRDFLKAFLSSGDYFGLLGSPGGGCGGGALPEIARLAAETHRDRSIAVITFPYENEGRKDRALKALYEIKRRIPTITVYNDHLTAYLNSLSEEKRKMLVFEDAHSIISSYSSLEVINTLNEVIMRPGNQKDADLADVRRVLGSGTDGYVKIAQIPKEKHESFTVEEVGEELVTDPFQKPEILKRTKKIILRFYGKRWTPEKVLGLLERIRKHALNGSAEDFEIIYGMVTNGPDDDMHVILLANAKMDASEFPGIAEKSSRALKDSRKLAREIKASPRTNVSYAYNNGRTFEGVASKFLFTRWKEACENPSTSLEEVEEIGRLLAEDAKGPQPDLPERYRQKLNTTPGPEFAPKRGGFGFRG